MKKWTLIKIQSNAEAFSLNSSVLHVVFVGQKSRQPCDRDSPCWIRLWFSDIYCKTFVIGCRILQNLQYDSWWRVCEDFLQMEGRYESVSKITTEKTSSSVLTAPSLMKVWHSLPTLPLERDIFFRKSSPLSIITFLHWERSCGRNTANITRSITLKERLCQEQ